MIGSLLNKDGGAHANKYVYAVREFKVFFFREKLKEVHLVSTSAYRKMFERCHLLLLFYLFKRACRKEIDIGTAEGVASEGVSPPVEISYSFRHSKTRYPVSSSFIFMFLSKPFSLKIVDSWTFIHYHSNSDMLITVQSYCAPVFIYFWILIFAQSHNVC